MKITLIEPGSPDWHVFSDFPLPRLGLPIISAILKKDGHSVNIFCEDLAPIDYKIAYSSDLIGISTTTSTAPRAYKIAR
ncbi:MAG: radical SAM protein, partial [bacterium]